MTTQTRVIDGVTCAVARVYDVEPGNYDAVIAGYLIDANHLPHPEVQIDFDIISGVDSGKTLRAYLVGFRTTYPEFGVHHLAEWPEMIGTPCRIQHWYTTAFPMVKVEYRETTDWLPSVRALARALSQRDHPGLAKSL